jgi:F0F1-type ATP synthase membrane subunit c/vacuolar-type H+-ATPase subunit K
MSDPIANSLPKRDYKPHLLIVAGLAASVGAGTIIVKFTNAIKTNSHPTITELVTGLILPHILLLTGLGLTATGIILIVRHSIIRKRLANDTTPY